MKIKGWRARGKSRRRTEPRRPSTSRGTYRNRALLPAAALATVLLWTFAASGAAARPEGTLTVAVATFGNERWLPNLYVGAEDVVLKPMYENLLTRDAKTGEL